MNKLNEEFDVVIKIKKLDDYRLRPQKLATSTVPIAGKSNAHSKMSSLDLGGIEKKIYAVIEDKKIGIKAKDLANRLLMSRSDVNHYLYGSLKQYVRIDEDYKWYVIETLSDSDDSSTQLKQEDNSSRSSIKSRSIDYNLLQNDEVSYYIKLFDKLVVSHRNGLNAPHKYILLISVFSLIGKGYICSNMFGSTKEIEEEFNITWSRIVPKEVHFQSMYTTPFWYLASEPFWNVCTSDGSLVRDTGHKPILSVNRQRKELTAIIDLDLYHLILKTEIRRAIIAHLEGLVRKGLNLDDVK